MIQFTIHAGFIRNFVYVQSFAFFTAHNYAGDYLLVLISTCLELERVCLPGNIQYMQGFLLVLYVL